VTLIHAALLTAVQLQPDAAMTVALCVPPAAAGDTDVGDTV
jgi:hypothetical protein